MIKGVLREKTQVMPDILLSKAQKYKNLGAPFERSATSLCERVKINFYLYKGPEGKRVFTSLA